MRDADTLSLDFDWQEPGILGDAFIPRIQALQKRHPVYWSERQNAWLVTGHAEIMEGLRDARFRNHRMHIRLENVTQDNGLPEGPLLREMRDWIFNQDGAVHARLRKLLMSPFSRSRAEAHRVAAQRIFEDILDGLEGKPSIDFLSDLALPYSSATLLDVVGLGHIADANQMLRWGHSIATVFGGLVTTPEMLADADATIQELTDILHREIALRRDTPTDDLLSNLIQISQDGDRLSEDEIVRLFHVLVLAGFETTANSLTLFVMALDQDAEARGYIRDNPDKAPAIIEELQRFTGMSGVQTRLAGEDVEWQGQSIRAGDMLFFVLCAGGWDERVFGDPLSLDFARPRGLQLMFAPGLHHCLGHNLAKVWMEIALNSLYRRFDRVRVIDENVVFTNNIINRSLPALTVRLER